MKKIKKLLLLSSLFLLTACTIEKEEAEVDSSDSTEKIEADEKCQDAVEKTDFSQEDLVGHIFLVFVRIFQIII